MRAAIAERGEAVIVLATGASQFETMAVLTAAPGIAWDRVTAFHLDKYRSSGRSSCQLPGLPVAALHGTARRPAPLA